MLIITHLCIPLFVPGCTYPTTLLGIGIIQNVIMLFLFSDFYYNTYIKPNKVKRSA